MENVENILLRASGIGALMTNKKGAGITENQLATLNDYESRIREGGKISSKQKETMIAYQNKRDAPFELSDTAKSFVEKAWLLNNKKFYKSNENKYTDKGTFTEEDCITLISDIDVRFYKKNTERITKGNLTGECDVNSMIDSSRVIQDVKSCWDPETFMNADLKNLYEWQGRTYMYLYGGDKFWLRYCLVDCPGHIYDNEVYKLKQKYDIIDHSLEEVKPLFDQLKRNLIFSDNENYTKEERVKTYKIERDDEKMQTLLDRIPAAIKYYNSIKLNQI